MNHRIVLALIAIIPACLTQFLAIFKVLRRLRHTKQRANLPARE